MVASKQMRDLASQGVAAILAAVLIPLVNALVGGMLAYLLGLSVGNALLLTILAASASYIAVPAVMRLALPQAKPGLYLPMSLGVTFPFNVCIGIPLYLTIISSIWPDAPPT